MSKESLGIFGVGAFGGFIAPYLAPHFDITLYDAQKDAARPRERTWRYGGRPQAGGGLRHRSPRRAGAAACKRARPDCAAGEARRAGDGCRFGKIKPATLMEKILPAGVDIVGTHPLFGPQSGKDGIAGLNIAVCNVRGARPMECAVSSRKSSSSTRCAQRRKSMTANSRMCRGLRICLRR